MDRVKFLEKALEAKDDTIDAMEKIDAIKTQLIERCQRRLNECLDQLKEGETDE